nr:MAG TPA: hypothetical protein [Bacteriophage sp.]
MQLLGRNFVTLSGERMSWDYLMLMALGLKTKKKLKMRTLLIWE